MIGPVSTIVLADLLLDERMGPIRIAGTILVLAGVFLVSQSKTADQVPISTDNVPHR